MQKYSVKSGQTVLNAEKKGKEGNNCYSSGLTMQGVCSIFEEMDKKYYGSGRMNENDRQDFRDTKNSLKQQVAHLRKKEAK